MMQRPTFTLLCVLVVLSSVCSLTVKKQSKVKTKTSPKIDRDGRQAASLCSATEVVCPDGSCISSTYVCDGTVDCRGGSDEMNCAVGCGGDTNKFQCHNGRCVPVAYRCDDADDCGDGTDETNCTTATCAPGLFTCATHHQCVPHAWVCDDAADCADHSDEMNCDNQTCSSTEFTCADGSCVDATFVCDGDDDCRDRSDETGCTCTTDQFACTHGGCVPKSYICDGDNDCNDYSDEHCPDIVPDVCADKMSLADCAHMNTTTFPICLQEDDAFRHCRKFCEMCEDMGVPTGPTTTPFAIG